MRILHFSSDDITGGAAKAAYRLHSTLRETGYESQMIVLRKKSDDNTVIQAPPFKHNPWASRLGRIRRHMPILRDQIPSANYTFNFDLQPQINLSSLLSSQDLTPGIICLHWITGLLDVRAIRRLHDYFRCPIVWVMADQEPLTGGCHYSFGCEGYTRECGNCPQLNPSQTKDHSHTLWQRKAELLANLPICFVAPTSWGKAKLNQSSLFSTHRCELIPYPIDPLLYRPIDRKIARDLLHLPQDKKIIFFGAAYLQDRRKGLAHLLTALTETRARLESSAIRPQDVFLLVAGLNGNRLLSELPFAGKYIGQVNDELVLALAYQAADMFVCPSVEDAGPMMVSEAMMCGTPVVAFDVGGAKDLIKTGENGYLARLGDSVDLAAGILALLESDNVGNLHVAASRSAARNHLPKHVATLYSELFQSLVSNASNE